MKKLYVLVGVVILSIGLTNAAQKLKDKQRTKIEMVQWDKINRQRQLARQPVYKMVDAAIQESYEDVTVNWPAVFAVIDSMRGVISVNEYGTFDYNYPLLWLAVREGNMAIAKTLLEKYKADPNRLVLIPFVEGEQEDVSLSPLMLACKNGDIAMIKLLLQHGANPNLQNDEGKDSFAYAKNAAMVSILKKQ